MAADAATPATTATTAEPAVIAAATTRSASGDGTCSVAAALIARGTPACRTAPLVVIPTTIATTAAAAATGATTTRSARMATGPAAERGSTARTNIEKTSEEITVASMITGDAMET